ncbi:MAG TPA: hypothetical protein VII38_14285 [Polyangia bacterium]
MRRVLLLALSAALAGCGPRPGTPAATLAAYERAVAAGRVEAAYALMSADYRRTHDRAAFVRALPQGNELGSDRSLAHARTTLTATVALPGDPPGGPELSLVLEDGAWRVAGAPLDFYPQATPEEALRSFLRAVERHRYSAALRFVPSRYRALLTASALRARWEGEKRVELAAELALVRAHLGDPFELAGDEARLPLGERKAAHLHREDGVWKVESLE